MARIISIESRSGSKIYTVEVGNIYVRLLENRQGMVQAFIVLQDGKLTRQQEYKYIDIAYKVLQEDKERIVSYYVNISARSGLLLGGCVSFYSSRFATEEQAKLFMEQAVQANKKSGRDPYGKIIESRRHPEIDENGNLIR